MERYHQVPCGRWGDSKEQKSWEQFQTGSVWHCWEKLGRLTTTTGRMTMKANPYTNSTWRQQEIKHFVPRTERHASQMKQSLSSSQVFTSMEFFWSTIQAGKAMPKLVATGGDRRAHWFTFHAWQGSDPMCVCASLNWSGMCALPHFYHATAASLTSRSVRVPVYFPVLAGLFVGEAGRDHIEAD